MTQNGEVGSNLRSGTVRSVPARTKTVKPQGLSPKGNATSQSHPAREGIVVSMLAKSYKRRPVVRNVTLNVRRGEAVGLLGPNGAGKTTVFYMLTGLIAADQGTISLDGADITHLPMYQRTRLGIGYLPCDPDTSRLHDPS